MNAKTLLIYLFLPCLMLPAACKKQGPKSSLKDITIFVFTSSDNPLLKADVYGTIGLTSDTISVGFPPGTDLTHLVPSITYDGAAINPKNKTSANFATPVAYTVTAQDGSSKTYIVAPHFLSTAKVITSFTFRAADNSGLSQDVSGIIANDTIRVYLDAAVGRTALVPTIGYTGAGIDPPGGTARDFTTPVNYTVTAEDGSTVSYTVIVSANVTVYVGGTDGNLYALDAATGVLQWKASTGGSINSSPTVAGGMVYVGSEDTYIYAFDAGTGALKWKFLAYGGVDASPMVVNAILYTDINYNGNYQYYTSGPIALNAATGVMLWRDTVPAGEAVLGGPTVVDGTDYETNPFGPPDLGALDAATGTQLWAISDLNGGYRGNPAVTGGTIYVGGMYHPAAAFDVQTHSLKWLYVDRNPDSSSYMVGSSGSPTVDNGTVFIPTYTYGMYAIDAATGTLKWRLLTSPLFSSPVAWNGSLFAGCNDGYVYALDETSGVVKWKYGSNAGTSVGPANPTVANGIVYCGSYDGHLYALDGSKGTIIWSFAAGAAVYSGPCVVDAKGNIFHPGISGDHQ